MEDGRGSSGIGSGKSIGLVEGILFSAEAVESNRSRPKNDGIHDRLHRKHDLLSNDELENNGPIGDFTKIILTESLRLKKGPHEENPTEGEGMDEGSPDDEPWQMKGRLCCDEHHREKYPPKFT